MSTKKNYIKGGAKMKEFGPDNHIINVDLAVADLEKLPVSKSGYIKITLSKLKGGPDKFGNTHSIYENDFVPEKQAEPKPAQSKFSNNGAAQVKKRPTDDLPF